MLEGQEKALHILNTALQMEEDGAKFYLEASRQAGGGAGKQLLAGLASEEGLHARTFREIYESIRARNAWPKTALKLDGGRGLRTIFARATGEMAASTRPAASELDAARTALDMESKSIDLYKKMAGEAAYPGEKEFCEALAAQEREHQLILLDYFEYLKDPASWFVKQEHPSLDAGG